jgi:putative zinc finger/helix-turn-helix YgiT family protein
MEKLFCTTCGKEQSVKIDKITDVFQVKDEEIQATISVCVCSSCGEEIWNKELEKENEKIVFDLYRKKKNLLSSREIKQIREQYGLSATAFSLLLGFGEKTITRYETGFIPDQSHNLVIDLAKNWFCFKKIWAKRKNVLTPLEIEKVDRLIFEKDCENAKQMFDWIQENSVFSQWKTDPVVWNYTIQERTRQNHTEEGGAQNDREIHPQNKSIYC